MSVLSGTIDMNAPITYVNKEWTEFMFRRLVGHYQSNLADLTEPVEGGVADADSGIVRLAEIDSTHTRITLEVEYAPLPTSDASEREEAVVELLERDLTQFKLFLEEQCRRDDCV